jgi:hypothetical protein
MHWQSAVPNPSKIDTTAVRLLDALEQVRPFRAIGAPNAGPRALGKWLLESGQDGELGEDTVVWLHRMLLQAA